jgi:hypothetical protein
MRPAVNDATAEVFGRHGLAVHDPTHRRDRQCDGVDQQNGSGFRDRAGDGQRRGHGCGGCRGGDREDPNSIRCKDPPEHETGDQPTNADDGKERSDTGAVGGYTEVADGVDNQQSGHATERHAVEEPGRHQGPERRMSDDEPQPLANTARTRVGVRATAHDWRRTSEKESCGEVAHGVGRNDRRAADGGSEPDRNRGHKDGRGTGGGIHQAPRPAEGAGRDQVGEQTEAGGVGKDEDHGGEELTADDEEWLGAQRPEADGQPCSDHALGSQSSYQNPSTVEPVGQAACVESNQEIRGHRHHAEGGDGDRSCVRS